MSSAVHGIVAWVVLVVVLGAGLHARSRVRSGRAFEGAPYRVAAVLVDIAVLLGIAVWADGRWWEVEGQFLRAWVHPVLGMGTLVVAHVGVKRSRDERWAAEAYAIAGRTLLTCGVLMAVAGAIAVA